MPQPLSRLADHVQALHRAPARWLRSEPVREEWRGETAWEGDVQVFELEGHPEAQLAYAWQHEDDEGQTRTVAVLGKPPIDSPTAAVRAAIVAEHRARS